MKILVVDDDLDLLERLSRVLKDQRYDADTAVDGEDALDKVFDNLYDLIILDIMLPKVDGLSVLKEIRNARINTPVLMLSARGTVDDRIKGLDRGADDYLPKPFAIAELMARVRSMMRRAVDHKAVLLTIEDVSLNTKTREVLKNGVKVELTKKEFAVLEFLLYNKNQAVSRHTLAEHVWGDDFDPFSMSNFIDVHIKNLRQKIDPLERGKIIRTVRGFGFIIQEEKE
jgi:DNA-binding response OmpR family regulator